MSKEMKKGVPMGSGTNIITFASPERKTSAAFSANKKSVNDDKEEKKVSASLFPDLKEYISRETMVLSSMIHEVVEWIALTSIQASSRNQFHALKQRCNKQSGTWDLQKHTFPLSEFAIWKKQR
jgi:hypothetical protein